MASRSVASGPPKLIELFPDVAVDTDPVLVFDWRELGTNYTALAFMVVNTGAGQITARPEMSPDGLHVVTVGVGIPASIDIPADGTSYDPYGIDLLARYWRLWLSGTGSADVYLFGLRRGG